MDKPGGALQERAMRGQFLRRMDWLGGARAQGYLRLLALLNGAMLVFLLATSRHGVDRNGFLLGSDFISFWTSGRMLHAGGNVYDGVAHIAAQRAFFALHDGYTAFFYPPTFLPLCWLLGLAGYFPALAAWLGLTAAAYVAAVQAWLSRTEARVPLWLLVLAFPAVPIVITHGQTAFLVAALLGLAALLVPARPILAGALLGLATIKPQFGVVVPFVLLFAREWKVIAAAAFTALLLAGASSLLVGAVIWADWLDASARARAAMEAGAVPFGKMVTVFAAARLTGAPPSIAYALQSAATVVVLASLYLVARRGWSPGVGAAMLAGAPLATPFALDYDLVLLAFPLLWLTGEALRTGWRDWEKLAVLLAFAAPAFARPLALNTGVPVMPLVLGLLFAIVLRRASSPDRIEQRT